MKFDICASKTACTAIIISVFFLYPAYVRADMSSDLKANEPGTSGEKPALVDKDWPWRRASIGEFAGITVAAAGTLYSEAAYGEPKHADWSSHNGFDESIRNALRLHSRSAQNAVGTIGDGLMGVLIAEPIVDSFVTLGYRDRRWDTLWQTSVINLESFTFTALVSSVMQNSIKRERPFQRDCPDGSCVGEQPNRGMPSGHVAFAFTGAGLYCTQPSATPPSGWRPQTEWRASSPIVIMPPTFLSAVHWACFPDFCCRAYCIITGRTMIADHAPPKAAKEHPFCSESASVRKYQMAEGGSVAA